MAVSVTIAPIKAVNGLANITANNFLKALVVVFIAVANAVWAPANVNVPA